VDLRVLAVIPARGGSKGIPGKNIKALGGKPLIAWTIDVAHSASYIDRLVVSTDDEEIARVARSHGADVPFIRPPGLATDNAPTIDTILHAVENLPGFDWILVLQPTSPFRVAEDIEGILKLCQSESAPAAVSIAEASINPYWMYQKSEGSVLRPLLELPPTFTRRQDLPKVYALNGALYLAEISWLKKKKTFINGETVGYEMPKYRSLDLDTLEDWEFAEYLIEHKKLC
jgi:CMP-N,N'-diacetyllegionaminic acid synthase